MKTKTPLTCQEAQMLTDQVKQNITPAHTDQLLLWLKHTLPAEQYAQAEKTVVDCRKDTPVSEWFISKSLMYYFLTGMNYGNW